MQPQCSVLKINFSIGLWVCIIIVRENKRFQQQMSKRAAWFFAYLFTRKRNTNRRKKIQCCDFLLNRRPHAKIHLIWMKKKNGPKFDIEWLCSDVFSCLLICTNSLSPHLRLHYPPPPPNKQKSHGYMYICLFTDVSPLGVQMYVQNLVVCPQLCSKFKACQEQEGC